MEDSAMDMTAVCNSEDFTKRELIAMQEKLEALVQENYILKKKIELLERVNNDLESELSFSSNGISKEKTKQTALQNDLEIAYSKIRHLELLLEEKNIMLETFIKEAAKKAEESPKNTVVVNDQEQLNILSTQIENLEILRSEDKMSIINLSEEKAAFVETIKKLKFEKQSLQNELNDVNEHLHQKTKDLRNLNETFESTREEKLLLSTELQMLKASDTNAARGNSLFAEVEENRQKMEAQRELLKLKYFSLKKVVSQKQVENSKLKLEIVKMRREEKDDEKSIHVQYDTLINTYKRRVSELENKVKQMEQQCNQIPTVVPGAENYDLKWVNTAVDNARKETRALQAELESRSSDYVVQGHRLFDSQKENRKLKASNLKLMSDIDELRLQLDTLKAAKENLDDGISPPATEISLAHQRQKVVKFKEDLVEHSNNVKEEKDSDKENSISNA